MSSELERRVRQARETLPDPDASVTERARERALGMILRRRSRRTRATAAVAATVVATLLVVGFAGASFLREPFTAFKPTASRIIDRTFVCTHDAFGGFPEIEVRAHAGVREGRSKWKQLPFAAVSSNGPYSSFVWITAGTPSRETLINVHDLLRRLKPPGTVGIDARGCRDVKTRVPLSAAGLSGAGASPFGDEFDCRTPPRLLLRVRAVLTSPGSLGIRQSLSPGSATRRSFHRTSVPVREARLAVRTATGKPLVYAEAFDSGKVRIFTAKHCVRE